MTAAAPRTDAARSYKSPVSKTFAQTTRVPTTIR